MTTCIHYSAGQCAIAGRIDSLRVCHFCPRNTALGWPDPALLAPVPIIQAPARPRPQAETAISGDAALAMDAEIDLVLPRGLKRGCCG